MLHYINNRLNELRAIKKALKNDNNPMSNNLEIIEARIQELEAIQEKLL